jgi:hypothetical protein
VIHSLRARTADDMHFKVPSQATYLCADMALYYLERAVAGDWRLGRSVDGCEARCCDT